METPISLDTDRLVAEIDRPVFVVSDDHRILAANRSFRELFDLGPRLAGSSCHSILHGRDHICGEGNGSCPLERCGRSGQPCRAIHLHALAVGLRAQEIDVESVGRLDGHEIFLQRLRPARADAVIVGDSPAVRRATEILQRAALTHWPVMIRGESGTGKALAARTLHDLGPRRDGPFVPVLCAGLTEPTWRRDLCGFIVDAGHGSQRHRPGLIDRANGGTLFLDDLCALPARAQAALLRVLDTGQSSAEPGEPPRPVDVRVVSSCHCALEERVRDDLFRQDLFYRLSVVTLTMPALRGIIGDLEPLVEHLLRQIAPGRELTVASATLERLRSHPFPGNVRELRSILEHAAVFSKGGVVQPSDLPSPLSEATH